MSRKERRGAEEKVNTVRRILKHEINISAASQEGGVDRKTIRKMADPAKAGIPIVAMTANAFEKDKQNAPIRFPSKPMVVFLKKCRC